MLDVGQPGELPLMRELNAVKKKGTRDPSTTGRSHRSPVLEAVPSSEMDVHLPFPDGHDELMMKEQGVLYNGGRKDGIRSASASAKTVLHRSPDLANDRNANCDFPKKAYMEFETASTDFHKQRDDLRYQLKKLGILNDASQSEKHMTGGKSLLHNWRYSDDPQNDENDNEDEGDNSIIEAPFDGNNHEDRIPMDVHYWLEPARDDVGVLEEAWKDGYRRMRAGTQGARRMPPKMHRPSIQNAQSLSPLVLNSHDQDSRRMSQSWSPFALEESYEEQEDDMEEEAESDFTGPESFTGFNEGPRTHSSFAPISQTRRLSTSRKHAVVGNSRHGHAHSDISYVDGGRAKSRLGTWDAEFFEYDVDSMEIPRKQSVKDHYRFKNPNPPKFYPPPLPQQGAMPPHESKKLVRKKSNLASEQQIILQQQLVSAPHCHRNGGAEPLPLLTELEDYRECDDLSGSSLNGDGGEGMPKQGEAMDALNRSTEEHAGHSLVKVEDGKNLQLAVPECKELALCDYRPRNLSQKYRPKAFEEVVGQNIVAQALSNAILRGKIAPVYLFQGSRGTGKTTAARIFAAALVCTSPEEKHPCGLCRECINVSTGKCSEVREVDAASNNGIEKVKRLLEETISAPPLSRYKVFIIDECHVLTAETWNALLQILEEPPMNVVFILITTDPDRLPLTAVSRCQKFPFPKIKEAEIVKRLQQLADLENFPVDPDTLRLIASRSDGSLRDAETTLDQLSLLGQDVKPSTVYELVGSASDERLLSLLDSALLADTLGTVRRARELVDSGVEPLSLMSRLATLITDILAGSFSFTESQRKGFFKKQTLSEEKLEWLRMAMKTLSEAEKQLRVSNDRATWLTAALLQLGPERPCMFPASCAGTSATQSPVALDDMGENETGDYEGLSSGRQTWDDEGNHGHIISSEMISLKSETSLDHSRHTAVSHENRSMRAVHDVSSAQRKLSQDRPIHNNQSRQVEAADNQLCDEELWDDFAEDPEHGPMLTSSKLDKIWCKVVEKCSPPLRQLLHLHGKLISMSMSEVDAVIHLEMSHPEHKIKCERSQKAIGNIFKTVLGFPVEVKISLASLPAENKQGFLTHIPVDKYNEEQESGGSASEEQRSNVHCYPLKMWKHGTHQSEVSECVPAESQPSFGTSVDVECTDQVAASWSAKKLCSSASCNLHSNSAMDCNASVQNSVPGNISFDEVRRRQFQTTDQGRDEYIRTIEYDDVDSNYSDSEIQTEMHSPETHERISSYNADRPNMDTKDELASSHLMDGRRSCDSTEVQKTKGSSLKMVRRLTMRSRTKSLASSNPNSPDGRGSSRFASKCHSSSQKSGDDSHYLGDEMAGEFAEASTSITSQKKSKLKGAAGTFARLFKGSR
ncbi:hypothetical protein KP509_09G078500 [Ceratopteris richardii]|nr:hypothetical protein KP509_09G078500 [Ceratopteris richardii]